MVWRRVEPQHLPGFEHPDIREEPRLVMGVDVRIEAVDVLRRAILAHLVEAATATIPRDQADGFDEDVLIEPDQQCFPGIDLSNFAASDPEAALAAVEGLPRRSLQIKFEAAGIPLDTVSPAAPLEGKAPVRHKVDRPVAGRGAVESGDAGEFVD